MIAQEGVIKKQIIKLALHYITSKYLFCRSALENLEDGNEFYGMAFILRRSKTISHWG